MGNTFTIEPPSRKKDKFEIEPPEGGLARRLASAGSGRASQIGPLSHAESIRRGLTSAEESVLPVLGMSAGSLMGGPITGALVSSAGGAVGQAINEVTKRLPPSFSGFKHALYGPLGAATLAVESYQKARGEQPALPVKPSLVGSLSEVESAAKAGAIAELGGRAGSAVLTKALAPLKGRLAPIASEAKQIGVPLSPASAVPSSAIIRGLQARAESSAAGRPVMQKFFEGAAEKAANVAESISARMGKLNTPFETGEAFKQARLSAHDTFDAQVADAYGQVDALTGESSVSFTDIKKIANRMLVNLKPVKGILRASDSKLVPLLQAVSKLPEHGNFSSAQLARSTLLGEIRKAGLTTNRFVGAEKQLAQGFDKAMMDGAEKSGSGIPKLIREANGLYQRGKTALDSTVMQALAKKNPEDIARLIWQPGAVTEAQAVKSALTGEFSTAETKEVWNQIRRRGFEDILEKATAGDIKDVSLGTFRGQQMLNSWERLQPEMQKLLGQELLPDVTRFMRVAKASDLEKAVTLTKNQLGFFETGLSLAVVGGVIGTLTGLGYGKGEAAATGTVTALAILASPKLVAKLMTSPAGIRWLTEGISLKAGTKEGMKMLGRFASYEVVGEPKTEQSKPEESNLPSFPPGLESSLPLKGENQ